jgi:hypothetical protein
VNAITKTAIAAVPVPVASPADCFVIHNRRGDSELTYSVTVTPSAAEVAVADEGGNKSCKRTWSTSSRAKGAGADKAGGEDDTS